MDDYEAIRRLLADYCLATDSGDTERWIGCFADEVVWEGGAFGHFEGKEAARAYHRQAGEASKNFRHVTANSSIDLDGERATVRSYAQVYDISGGTPKIVFLGIYDDRLCKRDDRWQIMTRKFVDDVTEVKE